MAMPEEEVKKTQSEIAAGQEVLPPGGWLYYLLQELRQDLRAPRGELKNEISDVRSELQNAKAELKKEISDVRTELHAAKSELREDIRTLDSKIDNHFKWFATLLLAMLVGFGGIIATLVVKL